MAPKYALRGYLTEKVDGYNFSVVTLEIMSRKSNTNSHFEDDLMHLLDRVCNL